MNAPSGGSIGSHHDSIVTGGGSGIGRAISRRLARQGLVGVLDRDAAGAATTVAQIEADGGRAVVLVADVTSSASLNEALQAFERAGGVPYAVVACAGVERIGTVLTEPEEDWDFMMDVNGKGVYLMARAVYPGFVERGAGSFIAIASDAGVAGTCEFGIYTASKHAVVGLIKCLALDFGHLGVRSNAVCPGNVWTPMMDTYLEEHPEEEERWLRTAPMGRFADPNEIADAVAFFAAPQTTYMNGSIFVVDGGNTAGAYCAPAGEGPS